jgi:biotin-dependent carboxylase-like uncharacterized protein
MDMRAHRIANALVGNRRDAATLEITLVGPELQVESAEELVLAAAGAEFDLHVDVRPVPMNVAFAAGRGSRVRFGGRSRGARAYLAVAGGVSTPPVLGSRATHLVSGMGGFEGRPLRAGDLIPLGPWEGAGGAQTIDPATASAAAPIPVGAARVRVLPGPDAEWFNDGAVEALQSSAYLVLPESNRMGYRLRGPLLQHSRSGELISDATQFGVLQVPASGQPILLMADRQVTGGYPRIATVISADIGVAGQLAPGDRIEFAVCDPRGAMAALIAQERALMAIEAGR